MDNILATKTTLFLFLNFHNKITEEVVIIAIINRPINIQSFISSPYIRDINRIYSGIIVSSIKSLIILRSDSISLIFFLSDEAFLFS
jgi:hypothetical protein